MTVEGQIPAGAGQSGGDEDPAAHLVAHAEGALAAVDALPGTTKDVATAAVTALVDVYGEGLSRMVDVIASRAPELGDALAADPLVAHLLLLHGLHPHPLNERIEQALDEVRPYLHGHGGDVSLAGIEGDTAVLRFVGACDGCPSSVATMQQMVEDAVLRLAPELAAVRAEGATSPTPPATARAPAVVIPVEALQRRDRSGVGS